MRLPYSSFLSFVAVGSALTSGLAIGMYLAGAAGSGSTSTRPSCKLQRRPKYTQQSFKIPTFLFVSSSKAAASHHRCIVAHDVFSSRVESKPASVHPIHGEFLWWSRGRVWFEQDFLTKRRNLLVEWLTSNTLVCCLPVTANVECCQSLPATSRLRCRDQSSNRSVVR